MTSNFPFEIFTVQNSCFTCIHNYGSVILWYCDILILVHFASDSTCYLEAYVSFWVTTVLLSDPSINDKWFLFTVQTSYGYKYG